MKKISALILIFFCCCATIKKSYQESLSLVTKIEYLDDGQPIIYIIKDSLSGIIIESNKIVDTTHSKKIEVGKKYNINVNRIERNYRGENSAFGIQSAKGTEKIIWRKGDSNSLILYKALNMNGIWLEDNN